jgi:hypothetical protein
VRAGGDGEDGFLRFGGGAGRAFVEADDAGDLDGGAGWAWGVGESLLGVCDVVLADADGLGG